MIDKDMQEFLYKYQALNIPDLSEMTVDQARMSVLKLQTILNLPPSIEIAKVIDIDLSGPNGTFPIRIYSPQTQTRLPAMLFFHGGGYFRGNIDQSDHFCRLFTRETNCIVISVGYHLAPEFKFPAALEDGYVALNWMVEHADDYQIDTDKIIISGESSGANLATVISLMARDRGGPKIFYQLLIHPPVDSDIENKLDIPEDKQYLISKSAMKWIENVYLNGPEDLQNPYLAPLKAESLANLPNAHVVTVEFDPLTEEALQYIERLKSSGVSVTHAHYSGLIHGFGMLYGMVDRATKAIEEIINHMKKIIN